MKLLDPFAGYRLACGHPFFHMALFFCSYLVNYLGDEQVDNPKSIETSFLLIRYGHLGLIVLNMIQAFLMRPSHIPTDKKKSLREILHRDDTNEMIASTLNIISVFIYQGIVFFVQLSLS